MKKLLFALLFTSTLLASEGKWTPQQVLELDPEWRKAEGLELPPERLWDPKRGTGLLAAAISTGGCSAGWISSEGLFVTNHHCLFGVLQEHATPENDIITNGFLARTRDAELRSRTVRITIPRRFTDVSSEVLAAIPKGANDAQRFRAIEKKSNEIVAACEKQPGSRCRVAAHDGGVQYVLQEMTELGDVRLVYAPPRAVGEFGGEIDNWMWPRHTGDFAIGRAYVDGKPFRPEFFFPLATKGVQPGDFVMVLGYPGVTYRALTAAEMEERHLWFTSRATVYRDWIRILEDATKGSKEGELAVAALVKTLANRQKNGEGQLDGFKRGSILEKQRDADRAVMLDETPPQLHARKDPLVELGFALNTEIDTLVERKNRWEGTISRLRPEWRRAVIAHAGKPVAPDANSTLRVSFAHVKATRRATASSSLHKPHCAESSTNTPTPNRSTSPTPSSPPPPTTSPSRELPRRCRHHRRQLRQPRRQRPR